MWRRLDGYPSQRHLCGAELVAAGQRMTLVWPVAPRLQRRSVLPMQLASDARTVSLPLFRGSGTDDRCDIEAGDLERAPWPNTASQDRGALGPSGAQQPPRSCDMSTLLSNDVIISPVLDGHDQKIYWVWPAGRRPGRLQAGALALDAKSAGCGGRSGGGVTAVADSDQIDGRYRVEVDAGKDQKDAPWPRVTRRGQRRGLGRRAVSRGRSA